MGKETNDKFEIMKQVMDRLGEILCSYHGRGRQSVYIDLDSLALFTSLIVYGQIKVENYKYDYNDDIYGDETAVSIYRKLVPQTRWRVGCNTQIEQVRMNALRQFAAMGEPVYKGYIYYEDIGAVLVCGEILPYEIFQLFTDMPEAKKLYIFPCPFREDDAQPAYYSFEPMESAREEMKKYIDHKFEEMCQVINEKSKGINIIPEAQPLP